MKKTLLATTAFALVAAHASAVDVELYGQVNKGLFGVDDGHNTYTTVNDNGLSSTRFGFKGAQALDNGLTASVLFEGEMASNPSDSQTQNQGATDHTPTSSSPSFNERQARVGLSGNFGGVYIGQQSTAIDGVLTQDLAGAQDVLSADYTRIGGGYDFRTNTGAFTTVNTNALTTSLGQERTDSVRYDSPIFYGLQGRASVAQGGDSELAAFYDSAFGDFKVKGAAGVKFVESGATTAANELKNEYIASMSVAHSSGLAGTLAYTGRSLDHKAANIDEGNGWYGKVGYSWDNYEVAADYGQSDHYLTTSAAANGDKVKAWGLGAQYNMGNGVSVAGLYRNLDGDITGTNTDSIDLYGVNMRVKF